MRAWGLARVAEPKGGTVARVTRVATPVLTTSHALRPSWLDAYANGLEGEDVHLEGDLDPTVDNSCPAAWREVAAWAPQCTRRTVLVG